jgi:two-component system cell cycle response regulator DivK
MSDRSWPMRRGMAGRERIMIIRPTDTRPDLSRRKTILVVEDNEMNMKLCRDLITMRWEILEAETGMEGLKLARDHCPDLILMDIHLPDASGIEITQWLKESDETNSIPVIAFTAMAMKGDDERLLRGGCDGYMPKPVRVGPFFTMITHWLNGDRVLYGHGKPVSRPKLSHPPADEIPPPSAEILTLTDQRLTD